MLPSYSDILEAVGYKTPSWWTDEGIPRFESFTPQALAPKNDWVVLYEISCQVCLEKFLVGIGWAKNATRFTYSRYSNRLVELGVLKTENLDYIYKKLDEERKPLMDFVVRYHYGDPPGHGLVSKNKPVGGGCIGTTMSSNMERVVEVWERGKNLMWVRRVELEGKLPQEDEG